MKPSSPSKTSSRRVEKQAKTHRSAFLKRIQNFAHQENLWTKNDRLLLAVSGGPDSMALLFFFLAIQKKYGLTLVVAHVNYKLRGTDSDKDAELVQKVAKAHGLSYYEHVSKSEGVSENALREVRFSFFHKVALQENCSRVALAHHEDDQAETLLIRLIRGSGSFGLQGMTPKRELFIRPFLTTPKKELLAFLKQNALPYRIDTTNSGTLFFRNKIRHELIPLLESYNPKIQKTLSATARILGEEVILLNKYAVSLLKPASTSRAVSFKISLWSQLSEQEQILCLRSFFIQKKLYPPSQALLATVIKSLKKSLKKDSVRQFFRLRIEQKSGTLHIHFKELS